MSLDTLTQTSHGTLLSTALPAAQRMGGADVAVTSCTAQADAVRPGDAFIVTGGEWGEDLEELTAARGAVDRGAVALVCERYLPLFGVPQYLVEDCRMAYSALCHAILGHPAAETNAVAIAGSYGKTSIALVLDSIFRVAGRVSACQTNQFTRIDGHRSRFVLPTSAPAIAEFLDEGVAAGCRHAVVELSEPVLRSQAASAAVFDVVCLSNLHTDNAAGDRSPQSLRDSMASALDLLSPTGVAVLNANDSHSMRLLAGYDGPAITFGIDMPAEVAGTILEQHVNEQTFLIMAGDETVAVRTKIVGEAHVENCLAAAAIAKVYGISLKDIARGIEQVQTIPGVMHRFDAGLGVSVFVDRGRSAVAKGAALSAAREVAGGEVIAVVDHECSVTRALAQRTIETEPCGCQAVVSESVAKVLAALEVTDAQLFQITETLTGIAQAVLHAKEGDVVVACGFGSPTAVPRRAAASASEQQIIQRLMYELANQSSLKDAA